MITALVFLLTTFICCILAIFKGPMWALIAYANIYFNSPNPNINWWGGYLPDIRWSLLTTSVLVFSSIIHEKKMSHHRLLYFKWIIAFFLLTLLITFSNAVNVEEATKHLLFLLSYCIIIFLMIQIIAKWEDFRFFLFVIIGLASMLSLKAYREGERIHARLENIGTADSVSSNEFGILLASVIPLLLPFLIRGKRYEKILCLLGLPFILNAFVLCNSRGAFVSLAVGMLYVFFLIADKKIRKYLILSGACLLPLFIYLSDEYFFERLSSLWISDVRNAEAIDSISTGRIVIWQYGMIMAKDHPLGVGPEGFRTLARFYMPPEILTYHSGEPYGVRAAHNSYLQVLVEQGVLGLGIFLYICFYSMRLLFRSSQGLKRMNMSTGFMGLLLMSLNMSFVISMMGGMLGSQVYYEFFWWQVAFSIIAYSFVLKTVKNYETQKNLKDPAVSAVPKISGERLHVDKHYLHI